MPKETVESSPQSSAETDKQNFHQLAQERKVLRRLQREANPETADIIMKELESLNRKAEEFAALRRANPTQARERLRLDKETQEKSAWLDESAIQDELGGAYAILSAGEEKLLEIRDFETQQLWLAASDPTAQRINERLLPKIREKRDKLQASIQEIEQSNPVAFRAYELVAYKKGLHREGHIAPVPSVEGYLNEIGVRMIAGKPMFLHGSTGTGKTSLARYAAEHFTGQRAEMVYCNPQTRESNIWGKQGLRVKAGTSAPETVDIYGPLAKAMRDGRTIIFDEFTALPQEQMVFVKGIFNAKPGDTVNVIGNGTTKIARGFQMIFTANLKSEKNKERQELPPEIAREFEQNNLEIKYTPKDEAYDIMLARLMNPDGSVDLSMYDLQETLPRLCIAMAEIQLAYTDQASQDTARLTQTLGPSNKPPGLKKLVFTQGTVENILDGWKTEKQINARPPTFAEYVDRRLRTALTFKEYPEADRVLAAKILASVGLLRTVTPEELGLRPDVFSFDAAKSQRQQKTEEIQSKSGATIHVTLTELVDLDPFKRRQRQAIKDADDFLPPEEETGAETDVEYTFGMEPFLKRTYQIWNIDQAKIDAAAISGKIISPDQLDWKALKDDIDASKFGEYTLNPDTKDINWDAIPADKIKIIQLPQNMNGKSLTQVAEYITKNYSATHHIPGIEYWEYILENPAAAPPQLKDGNYHFFFGSILRYSDGYWNVPCAIWDGSPWYRNAYWLSNAWNAHYRVVLVEK